jgi:hypothetical protein
MYVRAIVQIRQPYITIRTAVQCDYKTRLVYGSKNYYKNTLEDKQEVKGK